MSNLFKPKFQVGDKVKVSERAPKYLQETTAGREGTVLQIHSQFHRTGVPLAYEVEYVGGGRTVFFARELDLVVAKEI